MKRINCFTAGCDRCSNGVFVGENFWNDKLYSCSAYKRKHKRIDAKDCGAFRCKDDRNHPLCENCRKGK